MASNEFEVFHNCICVDTYISGLIVYIPDIGQLFHIPNKEIHDKSEIKQLHDKGTLVISQWLADQKRLI